VDAISLDIEKGGGRDGKTTEAELHEGVSEQAVKLVLAEKRSVPQAARR